jgi:putative heme iron utilization protein
LIFNSNPLTHAKNIKSNHVEGNVEIFMNESEIDWRRELQRRGLKDPRHW